jgi:hypothetical protein
MPNQELQAGRWIASSFGTWKGFVYSAPVGIPTSIVVSPVTLRTSTGTEFIPWTTNTPITLGGETVTPTAIAYLGDNQVQITAPFARVHNQGDPITSGTFGLQEAINAAMPQGVVVVGPDYQGTLANVLNASGAPPVTIEDTSDGSVGFGNYSWNGSAYVLTIPGGGASIAYVNSTVASEAAARTAAVSAEAALRVTGDAAAVTTSEAFTTAAIAAALPVTQHYRSPSFTAIASATNSGAQTITWATPFADNLYTVVASVEIGEASSFAAVTSIIDVASLQKSASGVGVVFSVANADSIPHTWSINLVGIHD